MKKIRPYCVFDDKLVRPHCVYSDERASVYLIDGAYWVSEYGNFIPQMFATEAAAKAAVDLDSETLAKLGAASYEIGSHGLITEAQVMGALQ